MSGYHRGQFLTCIMDQNPRTKSERNGDVILGLVVSNELQQTPKGAKVHIHNMFTGRKSLKLPRILDKRNAIISKASAFKLLLEHHSHGHNAARSLGKTLGRKAKARRA